ncbi:MAG: helix-turn-helix domain-containing protein [Desulfosudaceae bacterium]
MNTKNAKTRYLARLTHLVKSHDENRRERFVPFLILLQADRQNPRFQESLAIARYFLDNAFPVTPEDISFYNLIAKVLAPESPPDYFKYAARTPYPLADYLKVIYDLRPKRPDPDAPAIKQTVISQLQTIMKQQKITKTILAQKMNTSRASLDRLLDPDKSVTLQTLQKAARALDRDISLRFVAPGRDNAEDPADDRHQ